MTIGEFTRTILVVQIILCPGMKILADTVSSPVEDAFSESNYEHALDLIEQQLERNAEDPALLFQRARMLSFTGESGLALDILDQLRKRHPMDVDYALARAQILARLGRDADALDDLRNAVELAPDYEEVWQLRYTLLSRQRSEEARLEYDALLGEVSLRFPDATWWQTENRDNAAHWSIVAGAGQQKLSNGSPSWNEQFVEVSRDQGSWSRYRIGIYRDERFDNADISVMLGGDFTFASYWLAGLDVRFSSGADFQPDLDWSANIGRSFDDGWVVGFRYRHREYPNTSVTSATATVEKYLGNYRVAYALGVSRLPAASNLLNHSLTINWYYNDRSSLGVTINGGKEAEAIGPGQVLETDVRSASLGGRRQLTDRFGLQWWLGLHDQGDYYRREYLGLAVSIRL